MLSFIALACAYHKELLSYIILNQLREFKIFGTFLLAMENVTKFSKNILVNYFLNSTNLIAVDEFENSQQLLDIFTYSFCIIGSILNFFAFNILRKRATMGVLLIKLILISDGFVCLLYLINQIWTDIGMRHLFTPTSLKSSHKCIPAYVSIILRSLAIASVCVSNWYIVIMIAHRCTSIYVNPLRSRIDRSLWVIVQKPLNIWLSYACCWLFGILIAFLLTHNNQILLDVFMFALPLILVFAFSVSLLVKLWKIHRNIGPADSVFLHCFYLRKTNKFSGTDFEETFSRTQPVIDFTGRLSRQSGKNQKEPSLKLPVELFSSNSKDATRAVETERMKTYYRITKTILGLALSFLVLDSLQMLDLLIRIPIHSSIGGIALAQTNDTGVDNYIAEVEINCQKQNILSIVKNTCTLGKTLTNFFILCVCSRHFRAIVSIKFKRYRRLFWSVRHRMHLRHSRSVPTRKIGENTWFNPSIRRNTMLQNQEDTENCISLHSSSVKKSPLKPKFSTMRPKGLNSLQSLFHTQIPDDEGYVVHKFRRDFKKTESKEIFQHRSRFQISENRRQAAAQNQQRQHCFNQGRSLFGGPQNNNRMVSRRSTSNECSCDSASYKISPYSHRPKSDFMADDIKYSESDKSCCSSRGCTSLDSSCPSGSCTSNLTYPGASRTYYYCDCQMVYFLKQNKYKCCNNNNNN